MLKGASTTEHVSMICALGLDESEWTQEACSGQDTHSKEQNLTMLGPDPFAFNWTVGMVLKVCSAKHML